MLVSSSACRLSETNNRNNFGLDVTVNIFLFVASWPWTPDTNNYGFEQVLLTKHGKYFCIYIRCIIPIHKFTTPFPSCLEFETSSKVQSKSVPQVVSLVFTFLHPQVDHNMYLDSVSRMIIFLWQICLEGIDISLPKRFVVCQWLVFSQLRPLCKF